MDFDFLVSNLTNPTLLFFGLGLLATWVKSDLELPAPTIKFLSLYLLFSIGFKGGQEIAHGSLSAEILLIMLAGLVIAAVIPLYTFFILRAKFSASDAGAIAAAYGSVSAVTFVSASAFLEAQGISFGGHMVAVMALMEAPAIVVGVILIQLFERDKSDHPSGSPRMASVIQHSVTNGSVLMVVGSLCIGAISDVKQAEGIKPFTTDIFKGFLAIFLLEMGMVTAKRLGSLRRYGLFAVGFGVLAPLVHGIVAAYVSRYFITLVGDRLMFAILAASASYIAVPAAMKMAAPKADPGLYLPMALGITFPINITVGLPLYFMICNLA
jgi:uncharacterized protein